MAAVLGYEGYYEVSDQGRVQSLDRLTPYRGGVRRVRGRMLSVQLSPLGRLLVYLQRDSEPRTQFVHNLMLEAFVGPRPPGAFGCHYDDNPLNNSLSNLRWATPAENNLDMVRNGVHPQAIKTRCPLGHRLEDPNVRYQAPLKRGNQPRRNCISCHRAKCKVRYWRLRGVEHDLAATAAEYYADILKE